MARRNINELIAFADEHLLYEIEMTVGLAHRMLSHRKLFDGGLSSEEGELARDVLNMAGRNADIEAFVMHASNVRNFLRGKGKGGEVTTDDYFDTPTDWSGRSDRPLSLDNLDQRFSIEMGHLTITRRTVVDKDWPYLAIWNDLAALLGRFLKEVHADRISDQFRTKLERLLAIDLLRSPTQGYGVTNTSFEAPAGAPAEMSTFGTATSLQVSATNAPDLYLLEESSDG